MLDHLFNASEWITEVAEPIDRVNGEKVYECHIEKMVDAIDLAYEMLSK